MIYGFYLNLLMLDHTFLMFPKNSQEDYDNAALSQLGLL